MIDYSQNLWLPEPTTPDEEPGRRGEHTLDFLARATSERAKEYRRFLNQSVSALPRDTQSNWVKTAYSRWGSAFFELVVCRLLQEQSALITVEVANSDGRRPDFTAAFPDCDVVVEAISPVFDAEAGEQVGRNSPLHEYIQTQAPPGWAVCVWQLPDIGPNDSKRSFKRVIQKMLDVPPPSDANQRLELIEEVKVGIIHLTLLPTKSGRGSLGNDAPIVSWNNSEERIRYAVDTKRSQVRNSGLPALLAIHATGISSSFEDFDKALFGRTCGVLGSNMRIIRTDFIHDGVFRAEGDTQPTFAGVLAFLNVGPRGGQAPVLYLHPRFSGVLPEAIMELEQRVYDASLGIATIPAKASNPLERLGFVQTE